MKIKIDKDFQTLIPPLTAEEYSELEKSILAEGCRDSLIIWNDTLIEGHNRYEICTKHKKTFNTREHNFESKDKAKEWIILNQFGRRNLSAYDRAKLALKLKEMFSEKAKGNQGTRTDLTSVRNLTNVDTKKELAKIAGVSHDTISKVEKIEANATAETIAKIIKGDLSINEVHKEIVKEEKQTARKKEVLNLETEEKTDEYILSELGIKIELYNIWNFSKRDVGFGSEHFGNQPAEMMFNLFHYYTKQNDLVWDVFAGGGLTEDVCKKFNRKCYSTDLFPTRKNIVKMNVLKEMPEINPQFIFIDPPYWKQAENKYSKDKNDLANMPLKEFYKSMFDLFERINKTYKDFHIALLIGNTQWLNENKEVEPHALKMFCELKDLFSFEHHIIVPYSTQQYNGNQVIIAKQEKIILNLHRDLLIFKSK